MSQDKVSDEIIVAKECLDVEKYLSVTVDRSSELLHKRGIFSRQFSTCRGPSGSYRDTSVSSSSKNGEAMSTNLKKHSGNSSPSEEQVSCSICYFLYNLTLKYFYKLH